MSTYTIDHTTTLTTLNCGVVGCGIAFAIPESLSDKALANHSIGFYCPNGHHVFYTGKSKVQKAEDRANELARQLASRNEDVRAAQMQAETERRRAAAARGQLTKARNRADKGVCQHCNRSFVNVARHVAGQHPEAVQP